MHLGQFFFSVDRVWTKNKFVGEMLSVPTAGNGPSPSDVELQKFA